MVKVIFFKSFFVPKEKFLLFIFLYLRKIYIMIVEIIIFTHCRESDVFFFPFFLNFALKENNTSPTKAKHSSNKIMWFIRHQSKDDHVQVSIKIINYHQLNFTMSRLKLYIFSIFFINNFRYYNFARVWEILIVQP